MRYIKLFEDFHYDLAEDIAEDLYPKLMKLRNKGEMITTEFFDKYMKEKGTSLEMIDAVISYLVEMGFDFDIE